MKAFEIEYHVPRSEGSLRRVCQVPSAGGGFGLGDDRIHIDVILRERPGIDVIGKDDIGPRGPNINA
jgi:hypothetical protein